MERARALWLVLSLLPAVTPARAAVCIADPKTHAVSCYPWRGSGAPEESLKDLKQVTLDQMIEKGGAR